MAEKSRGWEERGLGDLFSGDEDVVDLDKALDSFKKIGGKVEDPNETSWITHLADSAEVLEFEDVELANAAQISQIVDLDNLPGVDGEIEIFDDVIVASSTSISDDIAKVLAETKPKDEGEESSLFSDDWGEILGENPSPSTSPPAKKDNPARRSWLRLPFSKDK
jgi:hypothetical protein